MNATTNTAPAPRLPLLRKVIATLTPLSAGTIHRLPVQPRTVSLRSGGAWHEVERIAQTSITTKCNHVFPKGIVKRVVAGVVSCRDCKRAVAS